MRPDMHTSPRAAGPPPPSSLLYTRLAPIIIPHGNRGAHYSARDGITTLKVIATATTIARRRRERRRERRRRKRMRTTRVWRVRHGRRKRE